MTAIIKRHYLSGVAPSSLEEIINAGFPYLPDSQFSQDLRVYQGPDHRIMQSAVQDQGAGKYCVPFAVASSCEYMIRNGIGGPQVQLIHVSESHISHAGETRHGDCTEGMKLWHALEVVTYWGVVTAEVWPYTPDIFCNPAPPDRSAVLWYRTPAWNLFSFKPRNEVIRSLVAYANGAKAIISGTSDQARKCLNDGNGFVLIDIPVLDGHGWDEPTDGTIQMPSAEAVRRFLATDTGSPPETRGWHAINLTSFDDSTGRFEFKNSWGTGWGDRGYGTIPYEYVSAFNSEMWGNTAKRYEVQTGPWSGSY